MTCIDERNKLVEANLNLARQLASQKHRTINKTVQLDELLSAAYVGLIDAAKRFDVEKANKQSKNAFVTYARRRIAGEMSDYLRACAWGTRQNPQRMMSLELPTQSHENSRTVLLRDILPTDSTSMYMDMHRYDIIKKILKIVGKREREIFEMRYVDDFTMREIGERLSISESRVSQIISDTLSKLQRYWQDKKSELLVEYQ